METINLTPMEYAMALALLAEAWGEGDAHLLAEMQQTLTSEVTHD